MYTADDDGDEKSKGTTTTTTSRVASKHFALLTAVAAVSL